MLQSSRFFAVVLGVALADIGSRGLHRVCLFQIRRRGSQGAAAAPAAAPARTAEPAPAPAPAAATPAPAADQNAKPVLKKDKLEIPGQIVFENASAVLKPESDAAITQLKQYPSTTRPRVTKLRIEGHTDNSGTPAGNDTLSGHARARRQGSARVSRASARTG